MFSGSGKADRKRSTGGHYEQEAALLLQRRIAEGRPPPDVWRKAEEGRAKRAQPAGWYLPAESQADAAPDAGRHASPDGMPRPAPAAGQPYVLRLVRLPPAAPVAGALRVSKKRRAYRIDEDGLHAVTT